MTEELDPDLVQDPIEEPAQTVEQLQAKELQDCKDKYLRLLAESENTRKRLQKEKVEMTRFGVENAIVEFLSPIDNLEKALSFTSQMSEETANWARGFQMILEQFKEALSNNGITPFSSVGQIFDPHCHDAVEVEESDSTNEGQIVEEYLKGYKSSFRTVRPARVKVARKPAPKELKQEM